MGNIASIASCKCNKQQDHSEMDLNKDKQELLKNRENSKKEDENFNQAEYQQQNINMDNIKFGEVGIQNKNAAIENEITPGENFSKAKESEKSNSKFIIVLKFYMIKLLKEKSEVQSFFIIIWKRKI